MKITYVFTTKVEKEDELVGRTSLNIKQRIIVISPDDVCQIASESEEYTKQWLSELRKLLKAKYSTEELRQKEEAKKVWHLPSCNPSHSHLIPLFTNICILFSAFVGLATSLDRAGAHEGATFSNDYEDAHRQRLLYLSQGQEGEGRLLGA